MNIKAILALIAMLSAFLWVSNESFEDEKTAFALYCQNVFGPNPIWPDYDSVGGENCREHLLLK
jgi:hypothetical protein